jgi:hypothetical protein
MASILRSMFGVQISLPTSPGRASRPGPAQPVRFTRHRSGGIARQALPDMVGPSPARPGKEQLRNIDRGEHRLETVGAIASMMHSTLGVQFSLPTSFGRASRPSPPPGRGRPSPSGTRDTVPAAPPDRLCLTGSGKSINNKVDAWCWL